MGRTGRHKEGRVVYILSAGREQEKYESIEEVGRRGWWLWWWLCAVRCAAGRAGQCSRGAAGEQHWQP